MSNTRARAPNVWILRGQKAGDYAQLQLLARALDVPAVTKQLVFRSWNCCCTRIRSRRWRRPIERSRPLERRADWCLLHAAATIVARASNCSCA